MLYVDWWAMIYVEWIIYVIYCENSFFYHGTYFSWNNVKHKLNGLDLINLFGNLKYGVFVYLT